MLAARAEHFDEQFRAAVDDARVFAEVGDGVDHAEEFDDALYAVEGTEEVEGRGEQHHAGPAGMGLRGFGIDVGADLAGGQCAVFQHGALAGQIEEVAGGDADLITADGFADGGEGEAVAGRGDDLGHGGP